MGKTSQSMGALHGTVWVLLVVLLTAGVLATKPGADEDVAKEINEAIDNDMQLGAASSNTPTTFSDLKPYLGAASKERWASKAVADIRGLSENQMAVSSVSENELNFARDAEEAKDVVDETVQMAEMKKSEEKQNTAESIKAQLQEAQAKLESASQQNDDLAESDDAVTLLEEAETEKPDEDFAADMYSGTPLEVQDDINAAISQQVTTDLGKVGTDQKIEGGLTGFAKDAEQAAAQIQNMKAMLHIPHESLAATRVKAEIEADKEAHRDSELGDAEGKASVAKNKLEASNKVSKMLAAARANLQDAHNDSELGDAEGKASAARDRLATSDKISNMLAAAQAKLLSAQKP